MKAIVIILLLVSPLGWSELWQRLTRDTSSHAANDRGVTAFQKKQYADAAKQFERANEVVPTPAHAFNAGTAEIAAGHDEQAARILANALRDPKLRADATYNRGNGALQAKQLDAAIHDYIDTLKLRPSDPLAKRNLEIALQKKQQDQQQSSSGGQKKGGNQPDPKQQKQGQQPSQNRGTQQAANGDPNAEALLRAVQQQEQEELQRMRKVTPERARVGW
jgi:tetratricopeptide (TPR) repeat protein